MTTASLRQVGIAATLMALTATAVAATDVQVGTAVLNPGTNATSNNGNSGGLDSRSSTTTVSAGSFDNSLGVLTGASALLTPAGSISGAGGAVGLRQGDLVYSVGGASTATATISAPGSFSAQTLNSFADLSVFVTPDAGSIQGSAAYTVRADRTAASGSTGTVLGGSAQQTLTYSYLQHANASFDVEMDRNTGSLTATAVGAAFNLYALAGSLGAAQTTALDSVSYTCVSGCSDFSLSLASFSALAAGQSMSGSVALLASTSGSYSGQYLLTFDDDRLVGVGQLQNSLTLNVTGNVAAVPEPETYAMFLAGLGVMGFLGRRRRKSA